MPPAQTENQTDTLTNVSTQSLPKEPEQVVTPSPSTGVQEVAEINTDNQSASPVNVQPNPIDPQVQVDSPMSVVHAPSEPMELTEENSPTKWVVVIVVLLLLIVALAGGAFYYLTQYKYAPAGEILSPEGEISEPVNESTDDSGSDVSEIENVDESDALPNIEAEVDATDLDSLDQELEDIEKAL